MSSVGAFPVPITVPVNIVPSELFQHSLPVNSVQATAIPTHHVQIMAPQQSQQMQQSNQLTQQTEEHPTDLIAFQMCQQNDLIYANMDATTSQQQRQTRN